MQRYIQAKYIRNRTIKAGNKKMRVKNERFKKGIGYAQKLNEDAGKVKKRKT